MTGGGKKKTSLDRAIISEKKTRKTLSTKKGVKGKRLGM